MRKCTCATTRRRTCVGHRLQEHIAHLPPGEKVFGMVQPNVMRTEIRKVLGREDPGAKIFGFKGFRAGHATEMARLGRGLAEILLAGEWSSRAFLRYVDVNQLEEGEFLEVTLAQSDDEETAPRSGELQHDGSVGDGGSGVGWDVSMPLSVNPTLHTSWEQKSDRPFPFVQVSIQRTIIVVLWQYGIFTFGYQVTTIEIYVCNGVATSHLTI